MEYAGDRAGAMGSDQRKLHGPKESSSRAPGSVTSIIAQRPAHSRLAKQGLKDALAFLVRVAGMDVGRLFQAGCPNGIGRRQSGIRSLEGCPRIRPGEFLAGVSMASLGEIPTLALNLA